MSIDRRKIIGLAAASAATLLPGCGGVYPPPPTRFVWLMHLNPEFAALDVSFGATQVTANLPFPGLTPRFEVEYGSYTVALRKRFTSVIENFDGVAIDSVSPSVLVYYRHFGTTRLGSALPGIVNLFDSTIDLDFDLFEDPNNLQLGTLQFEGNVAQNSQSANCRLNLYAAGSNVLVYDSGVRQRADSIIVFPRFPLANPRSGEVAVVGLNFGSGTAGAEPWPNQIGLP